MEPFYSFRATAIVTWHTAASPLSSPFTDGKLHLQEGDGRLPIMMLKTLFYQNDYLTLGDNTLCDPA